MLTRMIRIQLVLFVVAALVGIAAMALVYLQAPTMLGIGRINVKLELPASGGLYKYSNVTYRGVQVGKVTDLQVVDGRRVVATMSLPTSPRIPADLVAKVRSVSAVGEQYVDLQPAAGTPPYLHDGSVIDAARAAIPEPVGPMLDQLDALVGSIPKEKLGPLLDETSKAFGGAGYDIGSLLDSSSTVLERLDAVADQNRASTQILEHRRRDRAGEGALGLAVAILPADIQRLGRFGHGMNQRERRRDPHTHAGMALRPAIDGSRLAQRRAQTVHLPVADNIRPVRHSYPCMQCCRADGPPTIPLRA